MEACAAAVWAGFRLHTSVQDCCCCGDGQRNSAGHSVLRPEVMQVPGARHSAAVLLAAGCMLGSPSTGASKYEALVTFVNSKQQCNDYAAGS